MIFKQIDSSVDKTRKTLALFNKDWNTYKTNWQNANGISGKIGSVFASSNSNISVISNDQVQILRDWNNAVAHRCTSQETFNRIIANADDNTKMYFAGLNKGKGSIEGLKKAQNVATQSTIGLTIAQTALNMAISLGLTAIVSLIVKGYDELANSVENCKERVDNLISSYKSSLDTANNNANRVEELADKYEKLSKGVNNLGENVSLTNDEYKEYNSLVNEIAEMFPTLIQGWSNEGNAILNLKGNIEQLRNAYKEAQQEAYNLLITSGKDSDGNDIIRQWVNTHDTGFWADLLDLGADDVGGGISVSDALEQLKAIQNMTGEEYREIKNIIGSGSRKEIYGLSDIEKDIGYGSYLYKALGLGYKTTDDEFREAQKQAKALAQTYNAEIESALSDVETLANAYLMTNDDYDKLDAQSKTATSMLVNSLDADIANKFSSKEDVGTYVDKIVQSILSNDKAKDALTDLFTMDTSDMPIGEIEKQTDSYISIVAEALKENPIKLKARLGFDDSNTEPLVNKVKGFLNDEFDDKVAELKLNELQIATEQIEVPDGTLLSWDELIAKIEEVKNAGSDIQTPLSPSERFKTLWNSDDFRQSKEELLKLAEAGELSSDTLSSTKKYQTLLEKTGMTAYEASQNIYNLISQSDRLSGFSQNMENLDKAYADFKTNGYNTMDSLSGLKNAFGNLSSYKSFIKIAGDAKSSTKQIQKAYNTLVDEYLNATGILSILNEQNKGLVQTQLEHLGITNAEEIVANALNNSYLYLGNTLTTLQGKTIDVSNVTATEIVSLYNAGEITKETMKKLADYVAMKNYANKTTLSTDGDIQNLADLAITGSELGQVLYSIAIIKSNIAHGEAGGRANLESQLKELEARRDKLIKEFGSKGANLNTTPNYIEKNSTKTPEKAKDSYSKFAQTIDWCVQTITNMVNKIELLNIKLNNTKSLNKQISYYNSLIKAQQKLIKGYEKEESTYKKAYNKSLNKLSEKDRKKVENGTYTIEDFKGKAKSGKKSEAEKRYNNIQSALEARDTYLKSQTDLVNAKQQLSEYIETLAGIRWEKANESVEKLNKNIEVLDAKASNLNGYKSKNSNLDAKVKAQYKIIKEQQSAVNKTQSDKDTIDKKALNTKSKIDSKYKTSKRTNADGTLSEKNVTGKQLTLIKQYNLQIKKSNAYKKKLSEINKELAISEQEYITLMNESIVEKANNIQQDYENKLSLIDAKENQLDSQIALAEAKGQIASAKYYELLNQNSKQRISELKAEKKALENQLKGLSEYSDAWYEVKNILLSVDEQLAQETQNAVENISKQIEAVSNLTDAINNNIDLHTDSDFYTSLTDGEDYYDKNGMTDVGKSVLAAKYLEYTGKRQQRENLDKEWEEISRKYLEGRITEAEMTQLTDEWLKKAQDIDKEIISSQNAIGDMLTESYKAQLDGLKEIIDAKKKSLSLDKSEYDYQKSIAEKTKNIATLQKQLAMLEGRNDEEANAERQKIQLQLEDAQEDLDDTQYDKYIERVENALDDLSERFSNAIDELSKTLNHVETIESNIYDLVSDNRESIFESIKNVFDERGINLNDSGDWFKYMQSLAGNKNKKEDTFGTGIISERLEQQTDYLEKIYEKIPDDEETGKEKTKLSVADVLGEASEENKKADTSKMSALNKYLVSQGYKQMSTSDMADLASALRSSSSFDKLDATTKETISSITSASQLNSKKDINASANKNALLKALKYTMNYTEIQEFLDSHLEQGNADNNYGTLNRYLYQTQNGKVLSKEDAVTLGKMLGVSDANKNGMIDGKEGKELVEKLKQAGFSSGGIVQAVNQNGDSVLATLKAGESVLTPLQTNAFLELVGKLNPLNNTLDIIQKPNLPNFDRSTYVAPANIENVNFAFNLPNVVDSKSLIKTIQSDTQVQRTLQNATVGKLNGNTKFGVNKL